MKTNEREMGRGKKDDEKKKEKNCTRRTIERKKKGLKINFPNYC